MKIDRIVTSVPNGKTAALVTGRGVHWEPTINPAFAHHDAPPKTIPFPLPRLDLTGRPFGRFVVVGYLGSRGSGSNKSARWLVRCRCGQYEERRSKAICNPENNLDRCQQCSALVLVRKREYFNRTGRLMAEGDAYA